MIVTNPLIETDVTLNLSTFANVFFAMFGSCLIYFTLRENQELIKTKNQNKILNNVVEFVSHEQRSMVSGIDLYNK